MPLLWKKSPVESARVLSIPIRDIAPNANQPRRFFAPDGLEELAESIRQVGILQPLTVRPSEQGWELIAGERRLRAACLAGLTHVPCLVIQTDDEGSSLLALVENLQRRDLDFLEETLALSRLIDLYGLTQEECAQRIGKSQSAISNKLRLLQLPHYILLLLRDHGLSERHARALLPLEDPLLQEQAARRIIDCKLTVAKTEELVANLLAKQNKAKKHRPTYILKDVRLFLNTVERGLSLIKSAGVEAQYGREDTGDSILLTIRIPKHP